MTSGGYWVRHLWFIIVLLYGSAAAAMLVWRKPHLRTAQLPATVDRWIARHFALTLFATAVIVGLWEGAAIEGFYAAGLATNLPQQILRLDEVILFAPYFIGGCLMARAPVTLDRVVRFSPVIAGAAMVSTVAALAFMGHLHPAAGRFLDTIAAVTLTQTIIAVAKRYLDRPIAIVQQGVSAAFVIYLVHLPLVVMLVWLGQGLAVPVAFKATGVMVLTLGLSWGAWRCVAWSPILALLFNGEPLPAAPRPCLA
jgi:glucan biosynthesis protein C